MNENAFDEIGEKIMHEPNYETFVYKGYKCLIRRTWLGGQLNGYVGLPKEHEFYGKFYDDIDIECHGGLTFSGKWDDEPDDLWYIGFDTAHYDDFMPFMAMREMYRGLISPIWTQFQNYKDIDYVRKECKNIVDQLEKRENKEGTDSKVNQSNNDNNRTDNSDNPA